MIKIFERIVSERMHGKRLDHFLITSGIGASRNQVAKLIVAGSVLVNGKPVCKPSYRVKTAEKICARLELPEPFRLEPEPIPLDIVYEDPYVIVINKPADMVVHPARGHSAHTLVNALLHHCRSLPVGAGGKIRPGVLHRLDKDTTGLIIFAKTDSSLSNLGRQVESRQLKREYQALVWNDIALDDWFTIDAPVGRSTLDRKRMAVTPFASRQARTTFRVLERFRIATRIQARLLTGRTHQIRVHMAHYGHPVVGDPDYGGRSRSVITRREDIPVFEKILELMPRQALHAEILGFIHPATGRHLEFTVPPPADFQNLVTFLRSLNK